MTKPAQENALLQKRIAELEARLAIYEPPGTASPQESNRQPREGSDGTSMPETAINPRLLEAALSGLSDGVVICNSEGRLLHFNAAATAMFGAMTDDDPSKWPAHYGIYYEDGGPIVPATELPLLRAMSGEIVNDVALFTRTPTRPEGTYVECSARPIYDENQILQGAVVVCRDVGLQRKAEAERLQRIRADEQRIAVEKESIRKAKLLQALLDNLDLVVWSVDEKGFFTFHDGRGSEAVGVPRGSLVGQNIFDLYPNIEAVKTALGGVSKRELDTSGRVIWETWYVPVRVEETRGWNVIGLSLNVSEAHHAKTELEAKLALIERQQAVINDLETPIIQVWDRILTLPMVGTVDSRRAARVTDDLLTQVSRTQALFAILDLTGVEVVDTATAGHMLNIISAVRLLGAEGIITGIRPTIAQTMISLGVDLSRVRTLGTLRDGLAFAIRKLMERTAAANAPFFQAAPNPGP